MADHVHWIVFAYNRVEQTTGNFVESTSVDVIADSAEAADARVRELVPDKNFYYLSQVVEHLTGSCGR